MLQKELDMVILDILSWHLPNDNIMINFYDKLDY